MSSTISARVARLARFAFLAPFPPLAGFFGVASVNYDVTADGERLVMIDDEDGREVDLVALGLAQELDVDALTLLDARLLAAGADDCVHRPFRLPKRSTTTTRRG